MTEPEYSLTIRRDDGPILNQPRWVHYILKILIGFIPLIIFTSIFHFNVITVAAVSTVVISYLKAWDIWWKGIIPVKVTRRTSDKEWATEDVRGDIACDLSLHNLGLALYMVNAWGWSSKMGGLGIILFIILVLIWAENYPTATP